jgi:hypothetical protein
MRQDYEKIFKNLYSIDPPENLGEAVLAKINAKKIQSARIRLFSFGFVAVLSLIALIPAFQYAAQDFSQSGFYQNILLVFSDGEILISYWWEFAMSLVTSLPIFGITVLLGAVFVFLGSLKMAVKNIKVASLQFS